MFYPNADIMYRAFKLTPYNKVKVVILGQDPYHNPESATGLCFQVKEGNKLNPSLRNIMKKLGTEEQPDFDSWAKQGVLLLNTALTVEKGKAGSHTKLWEEFTEEVIKTLNKKDNVIWIMWGAKAFAFKLLIDNPTHKFVISSHPSPFSCNKTMGEYNSFNNSSPFKEVNSFLEEMNTEPVQ